MEIGQLKISRIGFGGLGIGGFHYGKTDDNESLKAVGRAFELGINFFDTADIYNFGKSEKIISDGLGNNREKAIIATKVGMRWDENTNKSYIDLSSKYIKIAVEKSLENLGLKQIPLYQIHYPDYKTNPEETMKALSSLKDKGKIGYIGCSNFFSQDLENYQKYGRIDTIQVPYNIADQGAEELINLAKEKWQMGVIAFSPLAQGLLSGKYTYAKFEANDRRNNSKYFAPQALEKAKPLLEKIKEISSKTSKTPVQVALRWILDNPKIDCVIVGAKTKQEVEDIVGAEGWNLDADDYSILKELGKKVL